MSVMYVPFPLDQVALRAPLPVNVWDPDGTLLLRKGEIIRDEAHRVLLESHLPMVQESEFRQWTFRYNSAIDRKFRGNESLQVIAGVTRPMGLEPIQADQQRTLAERWLDVHAVLSLLLYQGSEAQDFLHRLGQVEERCAALLSARVDDSLFLLVHMLQDRSIGYSTTHALLCAALSREVSQPLGRTAEHQSSLFRAALTMNIGMTRLQDELSLRPVQPSPSDRQRIDAHPLAAVELLHRHGVRDETCLKLVRHHHRELPPIGLMAEAESLLVMAHTLKLADVYVARLSPRANRRGLPPNHAARDVFLGADGQPSPMGALFIKTLGIYIPGSYVRLASGEVGVVVRRGRKANAPMVYALISRQGMPLGEPILRDTRDQGCQVVTGVEAETVKVRFQPGKLLARV
jgi:HD-GYP domain-containing protein (c-di-GMP phosphodiesterase class II)